MPQPSGKKNWSRFGCENQSSLCGQAVSTLQDTAAILTESLRPFLLHREISFSAPQDGISKKRRRDALQSSSNFMDQEVPPSSSHLSSTSHCVNGQIILCPRTARFATVIKQITDFNNCTFNVFVAEKNIRSLFWL